MTTKITPETTVLLSLGINYPLLLEAGSNLDKLPVLSVCPEYYKQTCKLFAEPARFIDYYTAEKDLKDILSSPYAGFAVLRYTGERIQDKFIRKIVSFIRKGDVLGLPLQTLPLVISSTAPISDIREDLLIIRLEETPDCITEKEICLESNDFWPVIERIQEAHRQHINRGEPSPSILEDAARCLFPVLKRSGQEDALEQYIQVARRLIELDENDLDTDTTERFLETFLRWIDRQTNIQISALPILTESPEVVPRMIYYDNSYIYFKDKLFKEIAAPLSSLYGIDTLKRNLSNDKVLVPSEGPTFCAKMTFYLPDGTAGRIRMLRFKRDISAFTGGISIMNKLLQKAQTGRID